jgi:sodium-dependent dicarboxylate transporter 2/3/5
MVASPLVNGRPWRILLLFGIGAAAMSSVMSHVVTTMIFIQIAMGLAESFRFERDNRYAECMFLAIAWGSNLGILTPVGTPPNLIAIGMVQRMGYHISFLEWIEACAPVFFISLLALFIVMKFVLRPTMPEWEHSAGFLRAELRKLGPMTRGEKIVTAAFLSALVLWLLPDLVPLIFLGNNRQHPLSVWLTGHLDWSISAVIVATSLFLIPVNWKERRFAMTWEEAVKGIEWGTLALIASALAIGNAIADPEVGLGTFLQKAISSFSAAGATRMSSSAGWRRTPRSRPSRRPCIAW